MDFKSVKVHPTAARFPLVSGKDFDDLVDSVRVDGLLHPIVMQDGVLLDGRNRLVACEKAGVEPRFVEWDGSCGTPVRYIMANNLRRRNLTKHQLRALAQLTLQDLEKEAKQRQREAGGGTGRRGGDKRSKNGVAGTSNTVPKQAQRGSLKLAEEASGIGRWTLENDRALLRDRPPETLDQIIKGEKTFDDLRPPKRKPRRFKQQVEDQAVSSGNAMAALRQVLKAAPAIQVLRDVSDVEELVNSIRRAGLESVVPLRLQELIEGLQDVALTLCPFLDHED